MEKKGLTAGEVIRKVFEKIKERHSHREIHFPRGALALIADDSDLHRIRRGYMKYDSAILIHLGNKNWALARGEACGDYPADPYDSDIWAAEIKAGSKSPEQIASEIREMIRKSEFFSNTIIGGRKDGSFFISKNIFGKKVKELLPAEKLSNFVSSEMKIDSRYFTIEGSNVLPIVKKPMQYKEELVDFLAQLIIQILNAI
jgi:hypothetical protein